MEAAEEARAVLEAEARRLARENVDNVDQSGCLELEEEDEEEEDEFDPCVSPPRSAPSLLCTPMPALEGSCRLGGVERYQRWLA